MRCLIILLLLCWQMQTTCFAWDSQALRDALPDDADSLLQDMDPEQPDTKKGFSALWSAGVDQMRQSLRDAMKSAFVTAAVCLLLSLGEGFASATGAKPPGKWAELAGATVILRMTFSKTGSLLAMCSSTIRKLDRFTKVFTTAFAGAAVLIGKPGLAAAEAGASMLCSDLVFQLSEKVILPAVQCCLLLTYAGTISGNGLLRQFAKTLKKASVWFYRLFLTGYFAYFSLSGLIAGAADLGAVRTAQSLSSAVPLIGTVLSGAAETILSGAGILRAGIGFFGFAATLAICLSPLLEAICYDLVFQGLAGVAGSFAEGGIKTMLQAAADANGMMVGVMTGCCAVQFITVTVGLTAGSL